MCLVEFLKKLQEENAGDILGETTGVAPAAMYVEISKEIPEANSAGISEGITRVFPRIYQ